MSLAPKLLLSNSELKNRCLKAYNVIKMLYKEKADKYLEAIKVDFDLAVENEKTTPENKIIFISTNSQVSNKNKVLYQGMYYKYYFLV